MVVCLLATLFRGVKGERLRQRPHTRACLLRVSVPPWFNPLPLVAAPTRGVHPRLSQAAHVGSGRIGMIVARGGDHGLNMFGRGIERDIVHEQHEPAPGPAFLDEPPTPVDDRGDRSRTDQVASSPITRSRSARSAYSRKNARAEHGDIGVERLDRPRRSGNLDVDEFPRVGHPALAPRPGEADAADRRLEFLDVADAKLADHRHRRQGRRRERIRTGGGAFHARSFPLADDPGGHDFVGEEPHQPMDFLGLGDRGQDQFLEPDQVGRQREQPGEPDLRGQPQVGQPVVDLEHERHPARWRVATGARR